MRRLLLSSAPKNRQRKPANGQQQAAEQATIFGGDADVRHPLPIERKQKKQHGKQKRCQAYGPHVAPPQLRKHPDTAGDA